MINIGISSGLLGRTKKLRISYRERAQPSYQITSIDSPLTQNLAGMLNFVASLETQNEEIRGLLVEKIKTLNCEFALICPSGLHASLTEFIETIVLELDAIVFAQGKTPIGSSSVQHFLDKNLELILDLNGESEVDTLGIQIDSHYFDASKEAATPAQKERKTHNEEILQTHQIKVNQNLPVIADEESVQLRSPQAIAERVALLAVTNIVAFNQMTGEQATDYLKKFNLWDKATPKEVDFLQNPTDERKAYETWKCEGIWTLLWALNVVPDLNFPDKLANLNDVPPAQYPIGPDKNPNDFIAQIAEARSKAAILNANDLYYRINWACVDARLGGKEISQVNPGVVYERHYALNWLINYRNQPWDEVTCDT
ncbi:hypothetical protein BKI52_42795 [marine bacterium AO1-C]|nr:hypothetical protein BKI52_42795 [marine bacterium AO1-C]